MPPTHLRGRRLNPKKPNENFFIQILKSGMIFQILSIYFRRYIKRFGCLQTPAKNSSTKVAFKNELQNILLIF